MLFLHLVLISVGVTLFISAHAIKIESDEQNLVVTAHDLIMRNPNNASDTTQLLNLISQMHQIVVDQQQAILFLNDSITQLRHNLTLQEQLNTNLQASISNAAASNSADRASINASLSTLSSTVAQAQSIASTASTLATSQKTLQYFYYDPSVHTVLSTLFTPAQAICTVKQGIWNPSTSTCASPLAYGTTAMNRQTADAVAIASCPAGYTPADCGTAIVFLRMWRLNPSLEATQGDAWCAGTVDGSLNSDAGKRSFLGFWEAADGNGQGTRPYMCATGNALAVDQCNPSEGPCGHTWRPHIYSRPETGLLLWMCMSENLPS